QRLFPRRAGEAPAVALRRRVSPGSRHQPDLARAQLLQSGSGAGLSTRRLRGSGLRARCPRPARRRHPPRPRRRLPARRLHRGGGLRDARDGRGGGRAHRGHVRAHHPRGAARPAGPSARRRHRACGGTAGAAHGVGDRRRQHGGALAPLAAGLRGPHAARRRLMDLLRMSWTFLWLSFLCIGGGLGIIPELERQSVTVHQWLTAREFLDGYTLAQLTPGPNMKVVAFVGYRAHGLAGGLLAAFAMFVPPAIVTAVVAHRWRRIRGRPWAMAVERTLAPIGIGLMAGGVYTLARSAIHDTFTAGIAVAAAIALVLRPVPPLAVMLAAGLAGWLLR